MNDTQSYSMFNGEEGANGTIVNIGSSFNTYMKAYIAIKSFCEKNFHPIKIFDSNINDPNCEDFKYRIIRYNCIHSGKYKSTSNGLRPNQKSFAMECPFQIRLRLVNKPLRHYKITKLILDHNHEIGPIPYSSYPKQRRLTSDQKKYFESLVSCNISNKNVRLFIQEKTGKVLTPNDVKNLKAELNKYAAHLGFHEDINNENLVDKPALISPATEPAVEPTDILMMKISKQKNASSRVPKTGSEKFVNARILTDKLATLLSQFGEKEYQEKLKFLNDITEAWENNQNIYLCKRQETSSELYFSNLNLNYCEEVSVHSDINSSGCDLRDESKTEGKEDLALKVIIPSVKRIQSRAKQAFLPYNIISRKNSKLVAESKYINSKTSDINNNRTKHFLSAVEKLDPNLNKNEIRVIKKKYKLSDTDLEDIIKNRMLNNNIINAGQTLIKSRFPRTEGLQDVLLGAGLKFKIVNTEFVQVLHCGRYPHWITISTIGAPPATVYIYNSLNEPVPKDAIPQICNIMNLQSPELILISKPMQIQPNNVDCGLFALASAITLLNGEDPSDKTYNVTLMFDHFLLALTKGYLADFSSLCCPSLERSVKSMEFFKLNCLCRQPILPDTVYACLKKWLQCNVCNKSYHKTCKLKCCTETE